MSPVVVFLSPCGAKFTHQKQRWSISLPISRLDSWIDLYRRMISRRGGKYARHYAADITALENFKKSLGGDRET